MNPAEPMPAPAPAAPSHASPRVRVVVVTFQSAGTIEACLQSLVQEAAAFPLEVVVVDNASTDDTCARVERCAAAAAATTRIRLLRHAENLGFSRGVNTGWRGCTAPYVLLLNPDSSARPGALAALVRQLDSTPDAGACGPRILSNDGSLQLSCRAFPDHSTALFHRHSLLTRLFPTNARSAHYLKTTWDHSQRARVDWVSGAALLVRTRLLEALGGLDDDYFLYSEDVDLCWRLAQAGYSTWYVPEATVVHEVGRSSRQAPYRALLERHRSMYTFYRKHYSLGIPLIDLATFLGVALRCGWYLTTAASGRSVGHHGETEAGGGTSGASSNAPGPNDGSARP